MVICIRKKVLVHLPLCGMKSSSSHAWGERKDVKKWWAIQLIQPGLGVLSLGAKTHGGDVTFIFPQPARQPLCVHSFSHIAPHSPALLIWPFSSLEVSLWKIQWTALVENGGETLWKQTAMECSMWWSKEGRNLNGSEENTPSILPLSQSPTKRTVKLRRESAPPHTHTPPTCWT